MTESIDVILPCLNEAPALPWVLSRVPTRYHVIVADNGSTDGSADVAEAHGAQVIRVAVRGFGAAAHAGLVAARSRVVCFMDADGSFDAGQLDRVTGPILAGRSDLILGRRRPICRTAWPWHARLGNAAVAAHLRRTAGLRIHDLGPMRAAHREALLDLDLRDRRCGYPLEMIVAAARAGWRIDEVDVDYSPRWTGTTSKVTGTVRGTLRTIADMSQVLA